jgi:predicted amidohydrolase
MLRIAAAQTPGTRLDQWRRTRELVDQSVARAAEQRAELVVLPECVWPAYFLGSVDDYFRARATGMPGDEAFVEHLTHLAREHQIAICAGHVAEDRGRLSNAVTLVGPTGAVLGTRHKCFLWDFDHALFEPGCELTPVTTPWGLIGLMICADARLPEIPATLVTRGARLILQPTAWVTVGPPRQLWNPQPALLIPERAREFHLPIASASKWGVEGDTTFVGSSLICSATGEVVARCGTGDTDVIVADVALEAPRRPRLTQRERARLLSARPATAVSADVPPLRVAAVAQRSAIEALGDAAEGTADHPTLLVVEDSDADPLPGNASLLLGGPTGEIHELAGIRVAGVRDRDVDAFAPIRALALDGAHLVVVFGEGVTENALRSRAAENRIFLVHATPSGIRAYDPGGGKPRGAARRAPVAPGQTPPADLLSLEVARSADKEFAPRTNPFAGRRPECYEF